MSPKKKPISRFRKLELSVFAIKSFIEGPLEAAFVSAVADIVSGISKAVTDISKNVAVHDERIGDLDRKIVKTRDEIAYLQLSLGRLLAEEIHTVTCFECGCVVDPKKAIFIYNDPGDSNQSFCRRCRNNSKPKKVRKP